MLSKAKDNVRNFSYPTKVVPHNFIWIMKMFMNIIEVLDRSNTLLVWLNEIILRLYMMCDLQPALTCLFSVFYIIRRNVNIIVVTQIVSLQNSFHIIIFPQMIGILPICSLAMCRKYQERPFKVLGFKSSQINQRHANLFCLCKTLQRIVVLLWKCNNRKCTYVCIQSVDIT